LALSSPSPDPRVYFAAERTLLAWLRTGITVMAFGFVVARFGLFLRMLAGPGAAPPETRLSSWLGAALVALGVAATLGGAVQYQRYCRALPPEDRPSPGSGLLASGLAWALAAIGVLLAVGLLR
jgi:putative membrane protein